MTPDQENSVPLQQAENQLRQLSPECLRVAINFLAYLQVREENEATEELMSVSGLEKAFREAVQEADAGEVISFETIRRDM